MAESKSTESRTGGESCPLYLRVQSMSPEEVETVLADERNKRQRLTKAQHLEKASALNQRDELYIYLLEREGFERQPKFTVPHRENHDAPPPLSFAQERFWFLDQFEHAHPIYNGCKAVRLIGRLNIEVLQECLNLIVHRHEVLRTTYPARDGKPIARLIPSCSIEIPIADFGEHPQIRATLHSSRIDSKRVAAANKSRGRVTNPFAIVQIDDAHFAPLDAASNRL